jgi:hypothetical protein
MMISEPFQVKMAPCTNPCGPFEDQVRELRECEFAGEIALTPEELRELVVVVRRAMPSPCTLWASS